MENSAKQRIRSVPQSGADALPFDVAPSGDQHLMAARETPVPVLLPLRQLCLDERSARKEPDTPAETDALADQIASHGLLCNLVVVKYEPPSRGSEPGPYVECTHGVVAGDRHLRALHRLVERGVITQDEPVLCLVVPIEHAVAVSLQAHLGQKPLGLADTVQAVAAVAACGMSVEAIASVFGLPLLTVQRHLKLASMSPRLFSLFRAGELKPDQLKALTLADSHSEQEAAWDCLGPADRTPMDLRRLILGKGAPRQQVRFVGIGAYEQAGGRVIVDLFAEPGDKEADKHVGDPALLQRLALEKLSAMGESLTQREGWSWVDVVLDYDYELWERYRDAPTSRRQPSAEQAGGMEALQLQVKQLDQALETLYAQGPGDLDEDRACRAAIDALEQRSLRYETLLSDLEAQLNECAPELAGLVGAMLVLNRDGGVLIRRNLLRQADWTQADAIQALGANAGPGGAGGWHGVAEARPEYQKC